MKQERGSIALLGLLALAAVLAGLVWFLLQSQGPPDGPVSVIWDKTPCAECRMHVGEPGFAAQLQTPDGTVHFFDDPGCLFLFRRREEPEAHAVWFHHLNQDRWLAEDEVAFARVSPTPMGFGFGAVETGTEEAVSPQTASEEVLSR